MYGYRKSQKKNPEAISFAPPSGTHGSIWYQWAINTYNRRFVAGEEVTPELVKELSEEYVFSKLEELRTDGARFERSSGLFLYPTKADQWEGVSCE